MTIGIISIGLAVLTGGTVYKIAHPIEEKHSPLTANVNVDVAGILNSIATQANEPGKEPENA